MEIWDGYLQDGSKAGVDLVRGKPVPEGLYHLVSEVLVRHRDGDYLLMQRSFEKPNYPGAWEATAGGSALKGEDALQCALRETKEETGIVDGEMAFIGMYSSHDTHYHSFLCTTGVDKQTITCQEGETIGYRWMTEAEFITFVQTDMIPMQKNRLMPWLEKMGYLK